MNKASLIEKIADKSSVSKKQAETMLESLVDIIISELQADNEVTITGFGTFLARTRHARGGVNPQNPSERIEIPEVKVAKFKTGKTLKDALKGKLAQPEQREEE
ncbi:MAG: HU family DNA-binding protein [Patescibacteria group bacterium]|jgi:DNA-binding protein HU-beta|nr:HU family DNA-binding protein [Patescibacteria group bacterium]